MNIVVVYNPKSGGALSASEIARLCKKNGITIDALIPIDDTLAQKLKTPIKQGAYIAALGGDGTIGSVAGLVVGTKATLIPLPGGTLNHFTKDLHIDQDIDLALANLSGAKVRMVDVAAVNDHIFINNSSIGFYPSSLRERSRLEDKLGKWPAAVIASFRSAMRLQGYTVTIGDETFRSLFIFVGNNKYVLDAFRVPTRASIDRGELSIFVAKKTSRLILLKISVLSLFGRTHSIDEFEIRTVKAVTIMTSPRVLNVSHDGEVSRMRSPLHYKIHAKKLRVLG